MAAEKKNPIDYTMERVKELCPAFKKGKACPYKDLNLKGLATGCPYFSNGCPYKGVKICPFKDVKTVSEFEAKLGEMRDKCKGKDNYTKALDMMYERSKKTAAVVGHCPYNQPCQLKADKNDKPILNPNEYTMERVKELCPAFEKGKACPYKDLTNLKGLATGCPYFKNAGQGKGGSVFDKKTCPFKEVETVGEFKAKLGEMRDKCEGKENYTKALDVMYEQSKETAAVVGHCPFHHPCQLKADKNDKPILNPDDYTMERVKELCPAFKKGKACPYKDLKKLKGLGTGCPAFDKNNCPFKDVETVGEFKAKLGEMRDECKGKDNYTKALDVMYKESKETAAVIGHCPFNQPCQLKADKNDNIILNPNDYTMERVKELCPAFKKGKACPYKDLDLKGLATGCPHFNDGCPFKNVKTVGEFKAKLGEMRDACKGDANYTKALDMMYEQSKETAAVVGHCPFHHPCQLKADMHDKPILNPNDYTMERVKELCPAFEKGKACPYKDLDLKRLATGCPHFKDGCPYKGVETVGEFKAKLGEMRDECKGEDNYTKALDMMYEQSKETAAAVGHCPFHHPCQLKADMNDKPILNPNDYTMERVKELCPAFKKGKACPYKDLDLKGLATGCPHFNDGCPYKGVKTVGEFKVKLGEMRDACKGKNNYTKALDMMYKESKDTTAVVGHCPFHQPCQLKADKNDKPILNPNDYTMERVKELCPAFEKGKACPYKHLMTKLKGLATKCPHFKHGCPFKNVKTVGEFKAKLGVMREACTGKENYTKALDMMYEESKKTATDIGHCPFHQPCQLKADMNDTPILNPNDYTMARVKELCPVFKKDCPYKDLKDLKGLGFGCPHFKDGCPFKNVKTVGEFKAKLGEMRDECKGEDNYTKALDLLYKESKETAAVVGHCPFHHPCQLKADMNDKPILHPNDYTMERVKKLCPAFKKGNTCPYKDVDLKGLASGCPHFKKGCPFKDVKTVGEFKAKLGVMRDVCKGKDNYTKALQRIGQANPETSAVIGHCPFHHPCQLKADLNGKPIM